MSRRVIFSSLCAMLAFCGAPQIFASEGFLVPAPFQAAIFKEVCREFLPQLVASKITIVESPEARALATEFQRAQFDVDIVPESQILQNDAPVVYVHPDVSEETLRKLADSGAFLLTGNQALVTRGLAAIGIVMNGDRASLVTHISQLEKSGLRVGLGLFRYAAVLDSPQFSQF